jgi:hypothetical protein
MTFPLKEQKGLLGGTDGFEGEMAMSQRRRKRTRRRGSAILHNRVKYVLKHKSSANPV